MGLASVKIGQQNERDCAMFFASLGCKVYQTGATGAEKGKRKRRGTQRTPGTPDFLVFHAGAGVFFFWEAKAGKAVLAAVQREFRDLCSDCQERFGVGDLEAAKLFAEGLGLCTYDERTGLVTRRFTP